MIRNALPGALAGAMALAVPAALVAQPTEPVQVPLRATIVSAAEISNAAIEVREGRFGRLAAPTRGFCEYSFAADGMARVRDTTGTYGPGIATPDGCIAADTVEPPRFDLNCAAGEQFLLRLRALEGPGRVGLEVTDVAVMGGRIERLQGRFRLTCTDRDGFVALVLATTLTLTPESAIGVGDLGTFELDTSF